MTEGQECNKKVKNNMTKPQKNSSKSKTTDIKIIVNEQNDDDDDDDDEESSPQTAKDLFAVFTPGESDNDEPRPKRLKETKRYVQKYKKEWENKPEFRGWLSESVHGNTYFYCKFCKNDYRCGISEIVKHSSSKKHSQNICPKATIKKFNFKGLLCPVFTPFTGTIRLIPDIKINCIMQYSNFLKACGINGILINDLEGMTLTLRERIALTNTWVENCNKNEQFLMVQIGGNPMKEVIDLAKNAAGHKVGAIVIWPDLNNKPSNHLDLIKYIKIISEFTKDTPLLYHHNPKVTNVEINISMFLTDIIGEIDSFMGIIYATNDVSQITRAINVNPEKFTIVAQTDEAILAMVAHGIESIATISINFLPKIVQSIGDSIKKGLLDEAQSSQILLNQTMDIINKHGGDPLPAMKTATELITGICGFLVRAPLQNMWEGNIKKLKANLKELGVI